MRKEKQKLEKELKERINKKEFDNKINEISKNNEQA